MTVYLMPLEPMEERYTAQWYNWFPEVLDDMGIDYAVINGHSGSDPELGGEKFLDPIATSRYKMSQMGTLLSRFQEPAGLGAPGPDDTVFFYDLWYPGMETLQYLKQLDDREFNIAGILHAGTYDPWDMTAQQGMEYWAKDQEDAWFGFLDDVIVGTLFHKKLVCESRRLDPLKVSVTGLPVDVEGMQDRYRAGQKEDRIVFTGRTVEEKGWDTVQELRERGYDIFVTQEHDLDKPEYYGLLAESEAVFAPSLQETFGYGVIEGMALGCTPVVPDRLAFQDTVPEGWRYSDRAEIPEYLDDAVRDDTDLQWAVEEYQYEPTIRRMMKEVTNE